MCPGRCLQMPFALADFEPVETWISERLYSTE